MTKRNEIDDPVGEENTWEGVGQAMLRDPLSPTSRKLRRNLVITSCFGAITSVTGIVPTKIAGVELGGASQSALVWSLILVIVYQWISFGIYSWPERMKYYGELHRLGYKPKGLGDSPVASIPAACRNLLDFFFPYVLALISIILLLWVALPTAINPNDATILGVVSRISLTVASIVVSLLAFINFVQKFMKLCRGEHEPLNPDNQI